MTLFELEVTLFASIRDHFERFLAYYVLTLISHLLHITSYIGHSRVAGAVTLTAVYFEVYVLRCRIIFLLSTSFTIHCRNGHM